VRHETRGNQTSSQKQGYGILKISMKKISALLLFGIFIFVLTGCKQESESSPTVLPTQSYTNTPTVTASAVPTDTPLPTWTPTLTSSPTASPTITPTPTRTPIIQSAPMDVDVTGPLHKDRPQLSGFVRFVDTAHFRIFYTLSGEDAVQVEDTNGNALPDYVEEVARALEHSWEIEIQYLGWAEPPSDKDLGGDGRFDVYLEDLDLYIAGYVTSGEGDSIIGDNPKTDHIEKTASYSYMGLDNDFAEIDELEDISLSGPDFMRTTVAHELNHAIQYGYDGEEPHHWLWEATSTWVETYVYDEIKDSEFHLDAAFKSPDTCLLSYGGHDRVESAGHWYAMWVFLRYLSERLGVTVIRDIWQQTIEYDGYDAFDAAFNEYGVTFEEVYRGFAIALLLRNFEFDLDYPTVRLEGVIEGLQSWAPTDGVGQTAADFVEIQADGIIEISPWNLTDGTVVGIRGEQADIYYLRDGKTAVDADLYDHIYLIMLNLSRSDDIQDCKMEQYRVRVLPGDTAVQADDTVPASNFKLPAVEPLQDS